MGRKNSLTEIFLHKKIFIRRETIATQKAQHCKPVASLNKSLFTEENGSTQKTQQRKRKWANAIVCQMGFCYVMLL